MLFTGSIRDNIERGKPGASIEEIEDAAKKAFAHDFITSFTVGVAGVVGMVLGGGSFLLSFLSRLYWATLANSNA